MGGDESIKVSDCHVIPACVPGLNPADIASHCHVVDPHKGVAAGQLRWVVTYFPIDFDKNSRYRKLSLGQRIIAHT